MQRSEVRRWEHPKMYRVPARVGQADCVLAPRSRLLGLVVKSNNCSPRPMNVIVDVVRIDPELSHIVDHRLLCHILLRRSVFHLTKKESNKTNRTVCFRMIGRKLRLSRSTTSSSRASRNFGMLRITEATIAGTR